MSGETLSYFSPKVEKRENQVHGKGLFAKQNIQQDEIVVVKGGYVMPREEWLKIEPHVGLAAEIQLSDELVIAPKSSEELEGCMMALNHSCKPNVGVRGEITYVAMRDVQPDEQLFLDYAMIDDLEGEEMNCNCGSNECRQVVTGKDWEKENLQTKYKGYFASFIQRKMDQS